jgi:hypothetical protein
MVNKYSLKATELLIKLSLFANWEKPVWKKNKINIEHIVFIQPN